MFELTLREQASGASQLWLRWNERWLSLDTYYFSLAERGAPQTLPAERARQFLQRQWQLWQAAPETCYVLLDAGDEYSRWIETKPGSAPHSVVLRVGNSTWPGYRLSGVAEAVRETAPSEFLADPEFPPLTLSSEDLMQSLQNSLSKLQIHQTATTDPTPLLEHYRGCYGTQLLVAAVAHFDLFRLLAKGPVAESELRQQLKLADRPCQVLLTALAAMRLIRRSRETVQLTELGEGHLAGGPFDLSDYIRLLAGSPDVLALVETLRTNHPQPAANGGTAFIFRAGVPSAMDSESLARFFTEALAGRARIVAPVLARTLDISAESERVLLDVGGGTGLYSIALLANHPRLRAIVLDRPEVLHIAEEYARNYGVADRLTCLPGDMFSTPLPQADYLLLSNILHDWDVQDCQRLVNACSQALAPGGQLWIHDVFLNDELDGPLPIALYSAALFSITEGRAYSGAEYRQWLNEAGLQVKSLQPTAVHCGVLIGQK